MAPNIRSSRFLKQNRNNFGCGVINFICTAGVFLLQTLPKHQASTHQKSVKIRFFLIIAPSSGSLILIFNTLNVWRFIESKKSLNGFS